MKVILISLLLSISLDVSVFASDWQFGGGYKHNSEMAYKFFDADTINYPNHSTVRFWIKSITAKEIDRYIQKNQKELFDQAGKKIVAGYIPKIFKLEAFRKLYKDNETLEYAKGSIILFEMAANSQDTSALDKILIEIDCENKRAHPLSIQLFDKNNQSMGQSTASDMKWNPIPPDTDLQYLSLMLCKKAN